MKNLIYTVGLGEKTNEELTALLFDYNINCVVDIRSNNYIDMNKIDKFKKFINKQGIYYIPMNSEFSFKSFDSEEILNFEKVRLSTDIKKGIDRIEKGLIKGFNIAVMGEKIEPLDCIRSVLIGYILTKKCIYVKHIISKEIVKDQKQIEEELLKKYGVGLIKKVAELSIESIIKKQDLEMDEHDFKNEMIEEAYRIRYKEIIRSNNAL
ncbi:MULTISPECIES: DUF488 domain-containing protein [Clostridium]|uniref:DUF488 domain-containing protein n=1 Tax=Clostridium TaxID=1485 RepID=UPI0008243ED9|nr:MULTISPECIES: DUF488 domain-containing protein [Clostridium]PJI07327.1 hypothetical protein CUB90_05375 [Clostridium sp. CT7]